MEEHACIDRAVLDLMVDLERQRPWADDEIARTISTPGDVRDSLRRLRTSRLIHRWNDLAVAAHLAVRFHEITQPGDGLSPGEARERHWDKAVLEGLLVRSADGKGSRTQQQTYEGVSETKAQEEARYRRRARPSRRRRTHRTPRRALDRLRGRGASRRTHDDLTRVGHARHWP